MARRTRSLDVRFVALAHPFKCHSRHRPFARRNVNNVDHQARGLRAASVPTKAKLTYYQDKSLTLQLQYKIEDTWTECFSLTPESTHPTTKQPISISIPSVAYLGFSAETGELSDNFDIINVEARNLYTASGYMEGNAGSRRPDPKSRKKYLKEREGGGWSEFLLKIVMFGFVVAGCYVGYTAYRSNKRTRF